MSAGGNEHGLHQHKTRAYAALNLRRYDAAERESRKALALDPRDPYARIYLAHALSGLARYEDAEREAREALALAPSDAHMHYVLGCVLASAGRGYDALAALTVAVRLAPHAAHIWSQLALAHAALNHAYDARETIAKALSLAERDDVRVLDDAVRVYVAAEELTLAEDTARKVLGVAPDDAVAHQRLASVLARRGARDEAAEHAQRAIDLDPNNWFSWRELGLALAKLDRLAASEWALLESLRLNDRAIECARELVEVTSRRGDRDGARALCNELLERFPKDAVLLHQQVLLAREPRPPAPSPNAPPPPRASPPRASPPPRTPPPAPQSTPRAQPRDGSRPRVHVEVREVPNEPTAPAAPPAAEAPAPTLWTRMRAAFRKLWS